MDITKLHVTELVSPFQLKLDEREVALISFLASYRNPHTRSAYAASCRRWFAWCDEHALDVLRGVKRAHVELWMRQMEEIERQQLSTINHHIVAVNGFYRYAIMDGTIDVNPAAYVKRPQIERVSTTNGLSAGEFMRIVLLAEQRCARDHAIFCLLGMSGLRASEVIGITVEEVAFERGYHTVTIHRKGGKTQTIPLSPRASFAMNATIAGRTTGPVFTSFRTPGKALTRSDLQRLVKRYAGWTKITKRISPHSFRHAFVTLSLDAGANPRDVQNSAGHTDPRMTSYYDRNRESLAKNTTHILSGYLEGVV